jgi:putative addiction module component (TIGR02574 family)
MTVSTPELVSMVESLPIEVKALLVEKLLVSMYPNQKEIDDLWTIEAQRRVEEVRSGAVIPISGDEVFEEVRKRFGG